MDLQTTGKKVLKTSGQFGAGVLGLGVGVAAMNMVPDSVPSYVRGAGAMVLAYLGLSFADDNPYIKAGAIGLGAAGALDLAKKLTDGKAGMLATINSKLPNLSGIGFVPGGGIPSGPIAGIVEERLNYGLGMSPEGKLLAA